MYHIRLAKALSYTGVVSATKQNPDVYIKDKATADKAVATGYFVYVGEQSLPAQPIAGHLDRAQLDSLKLPDLKKLAEDTGIDVKGLKTKADLIDAITAEEVEAGDDVDTETAEPDPEGENEPDYGEEE